MWAEGQIGRWGGLSRGRGEMGRREKDRLTCGAVTVYQGTQCDKGYGWELLKEGDGHCWDLQSFGSYEALCAA